MSASPTLGRRCTVNSGGWGCHGGQQVDTTQIMASSCSTFNARNWKKRSAISYSCPTSPYTWYLWSNYPRFFFLTLMCLNYTILLYFITLISKTRLSLSRLHRNADFDHGKVVGAGLVGREGNGQAGWRPQKGNSESEYHWLQLTFGCRAHPALNQCIYAVNIHLQPLYLILGAS